LGWQYTNFFYDMNAECWGWNRLEGESRWQHLRRLKNSYFPDDFDDVAFSDLNPYGLMKLNDKLTTNDKTYYFSITNGFADKERTKGRDLWKTDKKISKISTGFELDVSTEISFSQKRATANSWWRRLKLGFLKFFKYLFNPTFSHFTFHFES
jgi:hypothetical protein